MINFKSPLNEPGRRPAAWFITPLSLPASLTTVYQCDGICYFECKNKTLFWQDTVTSRFWDDSLSRYKHMHRWFSLSVCLSVSVRLSLSLSLSLSLCLCLSVSLCLLLLLACCVPNCPGWVSGHWDVWVAGVLAVASPCRNVCVWLTVVQHWDRGGTLCQAHSSFERGSNNPTTTLGSVSLGGCVGHLTSPAA